MNRPLVWVAVPFVAGLVVGSWSPSASTWAFAVAAACAMAALAFAGPSDRLVRFGCVLLFGTAGALYWQARHLDDVGDVLLSRAISAPDAIVELEGTVERPDIFLSQLGYGQFALRVDRYRTAGTGAWRPVEAGVLVRWDDPAFPVFSSDRVRVRGRLEYGLSTINPDVPSYEDYLRRRDVHTAVRVEGGTNIKRVAPGPASSATYWASRFRYEQAYRLVRAIPESIVPFVLTVWLGERRLIDDATYRTYVESGTAHILAVSGVHTGIVFVSAEFLLLLVLRDYRYRRLRRILVLTAVVVFALVAGARVSSLRAMTMIGLYVLAQIFDREPDAPTALSLAALLFTLHDPDVVFDPGFILSFLAIGSLLVFREPMANLLERWPRALREGLAATIAVQILPLPAAAAIFHVVPLMGTLANLIVVPLLTVALWMALLTSLLVFVWEPVAAVFGHALYPVVAAIDATASAAAAFREASLDVSRPTAWALAAYAAGAIGLYKMLTVERRRRRWATVAIVAFAVSITVWSRRPAVDEVVFLDVGQGDATIVRTAAGHVLVVDAGDRIGSVDYGERSVAAYLRGRGISRIHALVGTHADRDHQGGIEYLVRHFAVDALYLTAKDSGDAIEATLAELCRDEGIPLKRVTAGDRLPVTGADVRVLHPPADWSAAIDDNERSIVLIVEIAGRRFLLTGDIEVAAEARLSPLDIAAPVLKVPHHGSRTSSSANFIAAVQPEYAVVSTGRQGRKRILSQSILNAYTNRGVSVLRTDYSGGVRFRYDGGWRVETARELRGYPHPREGTLPAQ